MIVIGSALLGVVIGLGAGTYPALKAAGIESITALRGGGERSRCGSLPAPEPVVQLRVVRRSARSTRVRNSRRIRSATSETSSEPSSAGSTCTRNGR